MQNKITEDTAEKFKHASNLMWEVMLSIIKEKGYSDTTLKLEGSVHDLNKIIAKSGILK